MSVLLEVLFTIFRGTAGLQNDRPSLQSQKSALLHFRDKQVDQRLQRLLRLDDISNVKIPIHPVVALVKDLLLQCVFPSQPAAVVIPASEIAECFIEADLILPALFVGLCSSEPILLFLFLCVSVTKVFDFGEVVVLLLFLFVALVLHEKRAENDVTEAVTNDVAHQRCD